MLSLGKSIVCILLCFFLSLFAGPLCGSVQTANTESGEYPVFVSWDEEDGNFAFLRFSHDSGTYEEDHLTVLLSTSPEFTIAYTTDGTMPSPENDSGLSSLEVTVEGGNSGYLIAHRDLMLCPEFNQTGFFDSPLLPSGTVLTAALLDKDGRMSEPISKVYYPGVSFSKRYPNCLVLSVVTDPANLLDYETGILVTGSVYDEWKQTDEGRETILAQSWWVAETNSTQRGRAWEKPVLLQLYDGESSPAVELAAGIRVRGGVSRRMGQKSFNLYFRSAYGPDLLEYELFPETSSYTSVSLRSGGNETEGMKYKDAFLQSLVSDRDFTVLNSRPSVLFLNGEYWGPYCLQEKLSGRMLQDRYGVDKDQVVVIKDTEVEVGEDADLLLYEDLMSYSAKDLSDPDTYLQFCGVMDVHSMADYFAVRIYIGDKDWQPDRNDVLWRTRDRSFHDGRWQYILYDTEFSAGLFGSESTAETTDHFLRAIKEFPLFAAAVKNEDFFRLFLSAIREIGSECYAPERVGEQQKQFQKSWDLLMPDFYLRYGDTSWAVSSSSDNMLRFFEKRFELLIPKIERWGESRFP